MSALVVVTFALLRDSKLPVDPTVTVADEPSVASDEPVLVTVAEEI